MVDKDYSLGRWPMAIVTEVNPDENRIVRRVTLRTINATYRRSIHQLCLLEEGEKFGGEM